MTAGLLLLLGGCAQPEPSPVEPSASPSRSETPVGSIETTVLPATPPAPTPPVNGSADVVVAVADIRIAYATAGCPVTAWLNDAMQDDVEFGTYPEYLTLEDGSRWTTQLLVLHVVDATVTDWSFVLSSPLSGILGDPERRLISQTDPDAPIELAATSNQATMTTRFGDSENPADDGRGTPGTVSVTCR